MAIRHICNYSLIIYPSNKVNVIPYPIDAILAFKDCEMKKTKLLRDYGRGLDLNVAAKILEAMAAAL